MGQSWYKFLKIVVIQQQAFTYGMFLVAAFAAMAELSSGRVE